MIFVHASLVDVRRKSFCMVRLIVIHKILKFKYAAKKRFGTYFLRVLEHQVMVSVHFHRRRDVFHDCDVDLGLGTADCCLFWECQR